MLLNKLPTPTMLRHHIIEPISLIIKLFHGLAQKCLFNFNLEINSNYEFD